MSNITNKFKLVTGIYIFKIDNMYLLMLICVNTVFIVEYSTYDFVEVKIDFIKKIIKTIFNVDLLGWVS